MEWQEAETIWINIDYIVSVEDFAFSEMLSHTKEKLPFIWGYKIRTQTDTYFITVKDREKVRKTLSQD